MSASVGNALLCWAHSALIGQQLSASHVLLQLSNLCQAFSKKCKVLNTRSFSLLPGLKASLIFLCPVHSEANTKLIGTSVHPVHILCCTSII